MNTRNFIFSNNFKFRFLRHAAFWITRLLFVTTFHFVYVFDNTKSIFANILISFKTIYLLVVVVDLNYCYIIIYFLGKKFFLQKKYKQFAAWLVVLTIADIIISQNIQYYCYYIHLPKPASWFAISWENAIDFMAMGPPITCLIFISIKMCKTWYIKQEEKQMLLFANAAAEIKLLKAQVHPHFLFNTLNNIYSFALEKSPKARELVLQLSDMLKYMINDCGNEVVPLEKELKMLNDYIGLEKVRYGKRLKTGIQVNGDYKNKSIAPLLMIPFIENSFKHGASQMLANPWIKLDISISENDLVLEVSNSRPSQATSVNKKNGIGLQNVKKRLQLLYHSEYELNINSTAETYFVHLKIPLQQIAIPVIYENKNAFVNLKTGLYAQ